MSALRLVVAVACYLAVSPVMANAQKAVDLSGRWSVEGTPESKDFKSPAMGSDITIEHAGGKITVEYSMNRKRTWTLDGVEYKTLVRVADAGSYTEIGSAHIAKDRVVLVSGRDRGGHVNREERTLYRKGDTLIVEGTAWLDNKVINTSTLSYRRSPPVTK